MWQNGGCFDTAALEFSQIKTNNFGERGSSRGQVYYRYLVPIKLNLADVPWTSWLRSAQELHLCYW